MGIFYFFLANSPLILLSYRVIARLKLNSQYSANSLLTTLGVIMKKIIKAIVLASAMALPAFFAGNTIAAPSCGACVAGTAPASHTSYGVTNATLCTVCHVAPAIPATPAKPGKPTTPAIPATPAVPATGGMTIHPTSHSCGACVNGTAPSSVSAHKNVNNTMTACAVCHSSGSTGGTGSSTGGTGSSTGGTGSSTGGTTNGHSDDHHGTTSGTASGHSDDNRSSTGNSDFGHSHKHNKKQHRDHDD
jgi:uncharacterized membrane protein YgcG